MPNQNTIHTYVVESRDGDYGEVCESYDEARTVASDDGGKVLKRTYILVGTEVTDDFTRV
jgi:hypothetical protein